MLEKLINSGFGKAEDYNCAERILNGANKVYGLGLSQEACKVSAAFGGGMGTGRVCGAVVSALMVLGQMTTESVEHKSPVVRVKATEFQECFERSMGSVDCKYLKETYYNNTTHCDQVVLKAAALLDEFVVKGLANEG